MKGCFQVHGLLEGGESGSLWGTRWCSYGRVSGGTLVPTSRIVWRATGLHLSSSFFKIPSSSLITKHHHYDQFLIFFTLSESREVVLQGVDNFSWCSSLQHTQLFIPLFTLLLREDTREYWWVILTACRDKALASKWSGITNKFLELRFINTNA